MSKDPQYSTFFIPSSFELSHSSLLILISFLLPAYLIRFSLFSIPTTLLEILIWATFLLSLLQPSIRKSWHQAFKNLPRPVLFSILLFLFSAAISTWISPHLYTSLGILKSWIITPMLYAFMVYASLRHSDFVIRHLPKALILSGLVMALFGLSQVGIIDRIQGVFDVPNSLALFLAPLIILAACSPPLLLPLTKGETQEGVFFRLTAIVMFTALLFTQSLAGVLSVLAVLGFGLPRVALAKWGNWSLIAAAVVLCAIVLLPKIDYLLQPKSSASVRLQLWSISWDLIKEHPLLGIGLGTFEPAYQNALHNRFEKTENRKEKIDEKAPLPEFVFRDPHNWPISFWLNLGLLGLVSFAFLNGYALWKSIRSPAALALLTLLIFGLVDTVYWKNDLATLHFLLIALLLRSPGSEAQ